MSDPSVSAEAEPVVATTTESKGMVPVAELAAERKRAREAEAKLAAREKADAEAEQARLAEQGQFKQLADQAAAARKKAEDELASLKPAAESWYNSQKAQVELLRKELPQEAVASLGLDTRSVPDQLAMLSSLKVSVEHVRKTQTPQVANPPQLNTGAPAGPVAGLSNQKVLEQMGAVQNDPSLSSEQRLQKIRELAALIKK
mgnify:CR=1 FL=1